MDEVGTSALRRGELGGIRTVRDVARVLDAPGLRSALEREILAQPAFAARYARRARSAPEIACPPGSLGAVHEDFRAWYGLRPNFFPAALEAAASPLEFAACVLARDHDGYHVLCAYETSDADEVSLASFLCAQTPAIYACFVTLLERCQELADARFKHLRDLLDSTLDREAMRRGRAARLLVTIDLPARAGESLVGLRRALAIPPRRGPSDAAARKNTCGGKQALPYFRRASAHPDRPLA
jgi:ubiquinone biosynthesis protein Coq4